jgi:copper chaperone CopZ
MSTVTYKIPDISCNHCVHTIETELRDLPGVLDVKADANLKQAVISFEEPASEDQIKALLTEINYPPLA